MVAVKKVLILSVSAGGGHLRAAAALEQVFHEEHPEVNVLNVDALQYTNRAFRESFVQSYSRLATELPSLWGYIYEKMEQKEANSASQKLATLFDRLNSRRLRQLVRQYAPDRVISTHYFPSEVLAARRRKGKITAPIAVTLTDFDIHTMWVQAGVDHYYVATDEMAYALQAKGIGRAKVSVTGIPIMPAFAREYPAPPAMRRRLGLRPELPTVLVAVGGSGLMRVEDSVSVLAEEVESVQLLVVAGKNARLERALRALAARHEGRISVFGFVTNMHELMAASDIAVTKSGGLTSSECLALGLPMVILRPIPGQEQRNSDFLLESGVAVRANSAAHLVFKVRRLLADEALRQRMRTAARRIARPRAAYDIAADVLREE